MSADGKTPLCKAQVWCNLEEESRADYCKDGEAPETHCCKKTPPTPPICTEGQAISTGCTCQSPMEVQNGVCISSTPICSPPSGCSSAPTTGWPALLGLGALLPLLAARRRRRK
ncbi:MAG: hypothetical protein IJM64_00775 [Ottowia sp.]|nr:hypothetical protein [Ottowia sp.]